MDDPLRLGIVGVGTLTLRAILPHMTQDDIADRVIVTAVCDPVLERASAAAERFGVPTAVSDVDDLNSGCRAIQGLKRRPIRWPKSHPSVLP